MDVEKIFDRRALLKGRTAAVEHLKYYVATNNAHMLDALCAMLSQRPREQLESDVLRKSFETAEKVGVSKHKVRSFVAGYADVMMAFAALKKANRR